MFFCAVVDLRPIKVPPCCASVAWRCAGTAEPCRGASGDTPISGNLHTYMYMNMYMYMYRYMYMYMYMYMCMYMCMYVYMYIRIYVYTYIRIYVYMYICIYVNICIYIYVYVHLEWRWQKMYVYYRLSPCLEQSAEILAHQFRCSAP